MTKFRNRVLCSYCCMECYLNTPIKCFNFSFAKWLWLESFIILIILWMTYSTEMIEFYCGAPWVNLMCSMVVNLILASFLYFSDKMYNYTIALYTLYMIMSGWSLGNAIYIMIGLYPETCSNSTQFTNIRWLSIMKGVLFVCGLIYLIVIGLIKCNKNCKKQTEETTVDKLKQVRSELREEKNQRKVDQKQLTTSERQLSDKDKIIDSYQNRITGLENSLKQTEQQKIYIENKYNSCEQARRDLESKMLVVTDLPKAELVNV